MHRATWDCSACAEPGAWAPLIGDAREAVRMANAVLEVHQLRPRPWHP